MLTECLVLTVTRRHSVLVTNPLAAKCNPGDEHILHIILSTLRLLLVLCFQNTSIPHLPNLNHIQRLLNSLNRHPILLDNRRDIVPCCKVQHLHYRRPRGHGRPLDTDRSQIERSQCDVHRVLTVYRQWEYRAVRGEEWKVSAIQEC